MKNYNILKEKVETIFNTLNIEYELEDLLDDDLNYFIKINTIGKLKPLNTIECLIYFCEENFYSNFVTANIYKIKDDKNILSLYEILNKINMDTFVGNFLISGDNPKQIIYKSFMYCGEEFTDLDCDLIRSQIIYFISSLEILIDTLKKNGL
ncbi:MAG: hypothetical protein HDR71_16930 [Lachnospiraceae bacterium]|nr:hypothetical protein [Lachnospiraceae bacterium]